MACYNLGDYICESRKQLGITQEELAFGICSTGTLSKIENGFVVPKRKNYEAIMQRLGKTMGICNIHATAEEMELYAYMRQLVHAVANNDMEGSRELWQRQPEHKQEDKLTRQFFSYIKAVLDSKEGVRPELVYAKLEEALHLTHPAGLANLVQKRMFTFEEINIINSMAVQKQRLGERKQALRIWMQLSDYLEVRKVDDEEKEKVFDMFYTGGSRSSDSRRSLGLGLALCRSIITSHGGTISVSDNIPNGTVVSFTLPIGEVDLNE